MTFSSKSVVEEARDQLNLILSFFPRIDAKASVILALNTGMLGFLASKWPGMSSLTLLSTIAAAAATALLGVSFWFLYRVTFPELRGGQHSLIFFKEIAARTEASFIDQFILQEQMSRTKDLLGQVWRNSEILKDKFKALRGSLICTATAVVPWMIAIALFSVYSNVRR